MTENWVKSLFVITLSVSHEMIVGPLVFWGSIYNVMCRVHMANAALY